MRLIVGRGSRRQEWEVNSRDYQTKRNSVIALLEFLGFPVPRYSSEKGE